MKIAKTIWKGSMKEAEERDDNFWASQSEEKRLAMLMELRDTFFADAHTPIEKVVYKKRINEQ